MIDDVLELVFEVLGELFDIDGRLGKWFGRRRERFREWLAHRRAQGQK